MRVRIASISTIVGRRGRRDRRTGMGGKGGLTSGPSKDRSEIGGSEGR